MKFFNDNTGLKYPRLYQTLGAIFMFALMTGLFRIGEINKNENIQSNKTTSNVVR